MLAGFLTLSVVGHLTLLTLFALQEPSKLPSTPRTLQVALIERTRPEPLSEAVTETEVPPVPIEVVRDDFASQQQAEQPRPSDNETSTQDLMAPSDISEPEENGAPAGARLITNLNAQLPGVVAKLNPIESARDDPGHLGKALPKLPGGSSLFDQWLGPVKPDLDRWRDASGATNAMVTLPNGELVCIKVRAPTTQELFNPWMSIAVPMSRLCGRKKPESVNLENPWLRARPKNR